VTPAPLFFAKPQRRHVDISWWLAEISGWCAHVTRGPPFAYQLLVRHLAKALEFFFFVEFVETHSQGLFPYGGQDSIPRAKLTQAQGDNVDFVTKFEKELRKRHQSLMAEMAKIEHLINAFEKGAKRGVKVGRSRLSPAARKKISIAQKARWAKTRKARAMKG
jgi:hypothetical protein